ncbi:MAG TPA: hypothetical protein VFV50_05780 [Bdellovibrionales bacterium]|nr:hypothetical protein [Bdellovibrionales bacterium]
MIIYLIASLFIASAQANDSWFVKVFGPDNWLLPMMGPRLAVEEYAGPLEPLDREVNETLRYSCAIERDRDSAADNEWPLTPVGIESIAVVPQFLEQRTVMQTLRADLYEYVGESLGASFDYDGSEKFALNFARVHIQGQWRLNIDLYGGGRVYCQMPFKPDDFVVRKSAVIDESVELQAIPLRQTVEDRARIVLNQFFLVRLMTLTPNDVAGLENREFEK